MFIIDCIFESVDICKYIQDIIDRFNWIRKIRNMNFRFIGLFNDYIYGIVIGILNVVIEVFIIIFGYKFDKYYGFFWMYEKKIGWIILFSICQLKVEWNFLLQLNILDIVFGLFFIVMVFFFIEGYYMYIESLVFRRRGDVVRLWISKFNFKVGQCIFFWYYMFGRIMGIFNVYVADMFVLILVIGLFIWLFFGN